MKLKVPYLQWRSGRPRWEPGPALRKRGFKGRDLRDDAGQWLNMADAVATAEQLNAAAKHGGRARREEKPAGRTLEQAWRERSLTPEFANLKQNTRDDYHNKAQVFLDWAGDAPVAAIRRKQVKSFWRTMHDQRGHAMAHGVLAVLRMALEHAVEEEWIAANPCARLRLPSVPPRVVIWTPAECAHMIVVCDEAGEHGIADAFVTALHTAQRQGDVLTMGDDLIQSGRVVLRQHKTAEAVSFPATQILLARVEGSQARRATNVVGIGHNWRPLIVDDRTGHAFNGHTFRHRFAAMRAKAAGKMPELADKTFADLRDTAITRLYLADVPILKIAAISGHSIKTINTILRHYVALTADDGAAAIARLETWLEEQGVAV